jgi:hypothetical protein
VQVNDLSGELGKNNAKIEECKFWFWTKNLETERNLKYNGD